MKDSLTKHLFKYLFFYVFNEIFVFQECFACKEVFPDSATKHHCRNCGEGFCDNCSSNSAAVPHHGWFDPVRVCDACYLTMSQGEREPVKSETPSEGPPDVRVRRYGELVVNTLSSVATALDYPKGIFYI